MGNQQNNPVPRPKKWKMMLIAFLFVYPIINIIFFLFGDFLFELPQLLRTLVLAILFVLLFGIGIPTLQKKFYKWTIK